MPFAPTPTASPIDGNTVPVRVYADDGERFYATNSTADLKGLLDDIAALVKRLGIGAATPFWGSFATLAARLDSIIPESTTASNVNTLGIGVFKQKTGFDLEFKGLNSTPATDAITLTEDVPNNEIKPKLDILAVPTAATDTAADFLIFHDVTDALPKKVLINNLGISATDADAIHDNVSGEIAAVTEKVLPVAADFVLIEDSAAANIKKRVQLGNMPGADARVNYVTVKVKADFPTPAAGVITLVDNTVYCLNGSINIGTDRIELGIDNAIIGIDKFNDGILYTGSGTAITGTGKNAYIVNFDISASPGDAFSFADVGNTKQVIMKDLEIASNGGTPITASGLSSFVADNLNLKDDDSTTVTGFSLGSMNAVSIINCGVRITNVTPGGDCIDLGGGTYSILMIRSNFFILENAAHNALLTGALTINQTASWLDNTFIDIATTGSEIIGVTKDTPKWRFNTDKFIDVGVTLGTTPGAKVITHNLNTTHIHVSVRDSTADAEVVVTVDTFTFNTVTLTATGATITTDVTVTG